MPDLHAPPAFAALLDPGSGGRIHLAPVEEVTVERACVEGTDVVQTVFTTSTGRVRVTDALNTGIAGRLPWTELARRVEGLAGSVEMRWQVAPGTALGTLSPWAGREEQGALLHLGDLTLGVRAHEVGEVHVGDRRVDGAFTATEGSRGLLAVVATRHEPLHLPSAAAVDARIERTVAAWRDWSRAFTWDGPWEPAVRRAALALELLVHAPTGAVAAAATTSVPEAVGGPKNYDYRYAWVRDTAHTLDAFIRCGMDEEVHAALAWLLATIERHGPGLRPFYGVDGELPGGARVRDVPGYRGTGPVVDGNDAAGQLQLGPYGDLFQTVHLHVRAGHVLDVGTTRLLADLADACCDLWQRRDAGMWELPEEQHCTASRISCWQALDRAARLADLGHLPDHGGRWGREAARVRSWVEDHCWSQQLQAHTTHPGTDDLDAGVLLAARSGFDRGPRMAATTAAVRTRLGRGPLLHRYTGMDAEEGAFLACTSWAVEPLALTGQRDAAGELMDQALEALDFPDGGHLLTKMADPATGELLGNLPQALTHLALINAASAVAETEEGGRDGTA